MFFSKAAGGLFAISLGAISVLATPHRDVVARQSFNTLCPPIPRFLPNSTIPAQIPPSPTSTPAPSSIAVNDAALPEGPFTGQGTYFCTSLGACGFTNTNTDFIAAVSHTMFDAASNGPDPNTNPLCGKQISVTYQGRQHSATIVDRCVGCAPMDLDMSLALYASITNDVFTAGRLNGVVWNFT